MSHQKKAALIINSKPKKDNRRWYSQHEKESTQFGTRQYGIKYRKRDRERDGKNRIAMAVEGATLSLRAYVAWVGVLLPECVFPFYIQSACVDM